MNIYKIDTETRFGKQNMLSLLNYFKHNSLREKKSWCFVFFLTLLFLCRYTNRFWRLLKHQIWESFVCDNKTKCLAISALILITWRMFPGIQKFQLSNLNISHKYFHIWKVLFRNRTCCNDSFDFSSSYI